MASFPGSVKTFASRSNGQAIDATHINDLQDEVTALEDGYLNATARLNSSHSTVAALSVAGGSTFTVRPVMPPPDAVHLQIGSTLALSDGQSTAINWLTQTYMTNSSLHSTAANSSRLTPQSTGIYQITAHVAFNFNSSGRREIEIQDSSGGRVALLDSKVTTQNAVEYVQVTGYKRFDAVGGWMRVVVTQSGASTMSIADGSNITWCEMHKL